MAVSHCASLFIFSLFVFFFNDTATTEIYTLSLHDALPISPPWVFIGSSPSGAVLPFSTNAPPDRKSTRLNSSHGSISYAVFCLKKQPEPVHRTLALPPGPPCPPHRRPTRHC